jgi:hypothetical protein
MRGYKAKHFLKVCGSERKKKSFLEFPKYILYF